MPEPTVSAALPVLVASGDEGTRSHVRLTLGSERFEVSEADDSDSAVRAIVEVPPRLIVLDVELPGAGALALARAVAERDGEQRPRVLLLVPRGAQHPDDPPGVDGILALPSTPFALLRKIDEVLQG